MFLWAGGRTSLPLFPLEADLKIPLVESWGTLKDIPLLPAHTSLRIAEVIALRDHPSPKRGGRYLVRASLIVLEVNLGGGGPAL